MGIVRWFVVLAVMGCGRSGFDVTDADSTTNDVSATQYRNAVLADDPAAYFRLGEPAGPYASSEAPGAPPGIYTTTNDMIRYGLAGATGDGDTAVQFDGVGNLVLPTEEIALLDIDPLRTTFDGDFTVEGLIYPIGIPTAESPYSFLVCENYMNNGFRTGWQSSMRLRVWNDEAGGSTSLTSQLVLTPDRWQHVAITKAGTTIAMYIDGVDVGTGNMPDYTPADSLAECGIGSFHGMPSHGIFDELAIYTTALSAARVAAHAQLAVH